MTLPEALLVEARQAGVPRPEVERSLGWAGDLAEHSPGAWEHSLRVGLYALGLAVASGASPEERSLATRGGVLHDIGKLEIDPAVLHAQPFEPGHFAIVKRHALYGFLRLRRLDPPVASVAGLHHSFQAEPYYGTDPSSASGDVLWAAQVVAVCDFFDALLTRRDDRYPEAARSPATAREILRHNYPGHTDWADWLADRAPAS